MSAAQILSERILELRIESKINQEDTAAMIGIKRAALSHYETRRRQPDADTLVRIADHFNVTLDYLLGRSNERSGLQDARGN